MQFWDRLSKHVTRFLTSSTLDGRSRVSSPEIEAQILVAQERAWHEIMPVGASATFIAGVAVYMVMYPRVDAHDMALWLALLSLTTASRWLHATLSLRGVISSGQSCRRGFVALAWADGIIWSALGWYFTPLFSLEVAVVTISMLIGMACISASMLHVSRAGTAAYVLPVLVPNAFYAAGRHDDLGYFCFGCVLGLAVLLMMETKRANLRIAEMLRLRFESELANKAKTEALEQARQLADTKSRFVATMSHEMRTPLHGILGLLRQMQREEGRSPQDMRRLNLLNGSGEHLLHVINDVLDFSKIEAGGLPIHAEVFDLHALVMELAETSHVSCMDKGLSLDLQLKLPAGEHVHGDPTRVRQILHNLLGNAIKFTPQGGVGLHVWRDAATQQLKFEVSDTGVGISAEELPRVFEAFHQAEGTYKRRFGGTGLGLTISKDLARAMGGDLWCRSEVGQGSVFGFALPLPAHGAPANTQQAVDVLIDNGVLLPPEQASAAVAQGGDGEPAPHVLLVEDNPVNAMVAEAELVRLGVQVTVVDNGHEALDWLERQQPDLVLMDCEMPVMDGIETTRRIRERERQKGQSGLRIVALTANGADVYAERCRPVGMNDHLTKPFRTEDLARVLKRHLRPKPRLCFS